MADEILKERIKKLMGEFLDLSGIKNTREWDENLDHLEAIRRELNTLMQQFLEAWHEKNNPHIIGIVPKEDIYLGSFAETCHLYLSTKK